MAGHRVELKPLDFGYVALACVVGVWPWWCNWYGGEGASLLLMGLPFAFITYFYASLRGMLRAGAPLSLIAAAILWMGMPFCLIVGVCTTFGVASLLQYALELGRLNISIWSSMPLSASIAFVGEAVACLMWTFLLLMWCRQLGISPLRNRFFGVFVALFTGTVLVNGIMIRVPRMAYHQFGVLLLSLVATTISAASLVFLQSNAERLVAHQSLQPGI